MTKGLIHSTETFGGADGPGVRFVIFLHGCHMRCAYCQNPDTWAKNDNFCEMSAQELIDKALKYKAYWGPDGGITVSGGEPLLQIDFLIELFELAKTKGINTCIDTAGQPFNTDEEWLEKFDRLLKVTDLLLLDLKHIDPEQHKRLTGQPNDNILEMFDYLEKKNQPIWARYVKVPGLTDTQPYFDQAMHFLKSKSNVERVEILPYHTLGVHKWAECGLDYKLD